MQNHCKSNHKMENTYASITLLHYNRTTGFGRKN